MGRKTQTLHPAHADLKAGNPYRFTHRSPHAGRWPKKKRVNGSWRQLLSFYTPLTSLVPMVGGELFLLSLCEHSFLPKPAQFPQTERPELPTPATGQKAATVCLNSIRAMTRRTVRPLWVPPASAVQTRHGLPGREIGRVSPRVRPRRQPKKPTLYVCPVFALKRDLGSADLRRHSCCAWTARTPQKRNAAQRRRLDTDV